MSIGSGRTLGPYEIVGELGRGGMGAVYRARQPGLGRFVAIKLLPPYLAADPSFRQRFAAEALAVGRLRHPNIVGAIDFGEHEGQAYLVYDYVDGGTLADQIGKPLPPDYVARMLAPIASALDYAHTKGLVHRDVKPSNVLVGRDGVPLLSDFGLAQIVGPTPRLTEPGATVGTPEYMSPEQARGEGATAAADRYALAVIAYEMLTGRLPFQRDHPVATLLAHAGDPVEFPAEPHLPGALQAVLRRGLAKSPDERFGTCADLVRALAEPQAVPPPSTTRTPARGRSKRRWLFAAAVAALVALAAVVTLQPPAAPEEQVSEPPPEAVAAPPLHAVPPKGRLIYQAALDGTARDLRLPRSDDGRSDASALRLERGAVVLEVLDDGGSTSVRLNMPARASYVGELDVVVPRRAAATFTWLVRQRPSDGAGYVVTLDLRSGAVEIAFFDPADGAAHPLTSAATAPIAADRHVTLAVSLKGSTLALFVDQRPVATVTDERIASPTVPEVGINGAVAQARIVGARFYEVP